MPHASKSCVAALCALALAGTALDAFAVTSLGTGTAALIDGDLTDPENDGDQFAVTMPPGQGANFNWTSISASSEPFFTPAGGNEGAYDVFDNLVGATVDKWCCDPAPQNIAVTFAAPYVLTRFTIASGNDAPERDPDVWFIEGSNDGTTWVPIFSYSNPGVSPFTQRLEVLRYDGGGVDFATPAAYTRFRYRVESTVTDGTLHQINELEFFGAQLFASNVPALDARALAALALVLLGAGVFGLRRYAGS
jgi:hypothetical protein